MRDALLAAAFFGVVLLVFWMGMSFLTGPDLAGLAALASVPAIGFVAAWRSPQLVDSAERFNEPRRGLRHGAGITTLAYVGAVGLLTIWRGLPAAPGGPNPLEFFCIGLAMGLLLVPLTLPVGMAAGLMFDTYIRSTLDAQPDSHADIAPSPNPITLKPARRLFASSSPTWRRRSRRGSSTG